MLKVRALALLCGLLLTGCATTLRPPPADLVFLPAEPSLWKLSLRHHDQPLYAGLLALSRGPDGSAGMVLLDPTGIKLLEGRVAAAGEIFAVKALRPVADRGLPAFLGRAVQRLFLGVVPGSGQVCREESPGELCLGLDERDRLVKIRSWGPFVLWGADYSLNNDGEAPLVIGAALDGGWLTPEVRLERRFEESE